MDIFLPPRMPNSVVSLSALRVTAQNPTNQAPPLDLAIQNADTIEDLIRILPKSFQAPFGPLLKYFQDISTKVGNCQKSVSSLETHLAKKSFPANILGALKVPVIQVSKEYSEGNSSSSFIAACEVVLKEAREQLLSYSLTYKRNELSFLSSLLSEKELQSKVDKTICQVQVQVLPFFSAGDEKTGISSYFKEEIKIIQEHGLNLCRKAITLGFYKYQRELATKLKNLSIVKEADVEMRDSTSTSIEKAIEIAVANALKSKTKQPPPPKPKKAKKDILKPKPLKKKVDKQSKGKGITKNKSKKK